MCINIEINKILYADCSALLLGGKNMSAFLGPIHHWLFNKITLFEDLEKDINRKVVAKYGQQASTIQSEAEKKYGAFIPELPLENLIDTNNIHGWLQNRISIAEKRQAETLTSFVNAFGGEVISMIEDRYVAQGAKAGKVAGESKSLEAPSIYQELNNYLLEGMPCDNVNSVTISEPNFLEWNTIGCLHKPYWNEVGADSKLMYQLRFAWIKAFIENANSKYTYRNEAKNQGFVHQIIEK